ncbi:uncharacterized protein TM35_000142580 [Trypanosoma theileri]|uniref:Uncharacterized protein n=1 Tax=Trypanosoma theileri TaxID=67003 RepID=A0A1X0NWG7_9TRYP|nr:uncharacterized protein TM35_000142580 [Trypanosoma theileri]ORC89047.1 hypothetical protein TM35_000142580 [Trypanosoma theileri]
MCANDDNQYSTYMFWGTQLTSTSVVSIVFRCSVLAAVLCTSLVAQAYSVRYTYVTSPTPVSARFSGYCPERSGGHTMMPMTESFQTLAQGIIVQGKFADAPIGGINPATSCTTERCPWIFHTGLMNGTPVEKSTFLYGAVYKGVDHTEAVPGMYHNFQKGVQPVSFLSPEDNVIPKMLKNGFWLTDLRDREYTTWVCEYYDFTAFKQEIATESNDTDSAAEEESSGFLWWYGLIIGLFVLLAVVVLVIACWWRVKHEEKLQKEEVEGDTRIGENVTRIPTQLEVGVGPSPSVFKNTSCVGPSGFGRNGSVSNSRRNSRRGSSFAGNPYSSGYGDPGFPQRRMSHGEPGGFQPQRDIYAQEVFSPQGW